jgi:hypothetical protein
MYCKGDNTLIIIITTTNIYMTKTLRNREVSFMSSGRNATFFFYVSGFTILGHFTGRFEPRIAARPHVPPHWRWAAIHHASNRTVFSRPSWYSVSGVANILIRRPLCYLDEQSWNRSCISGQVQSWHPPPPSKTDILWTLLCGCVGRCDLEPT